MSRRQENATCGDTVRNQTTGQLQRSLLAALVLIDVEGDIHLAFAFTELAELGVVQIVCPVSRSRCGIPLAAERHSRTVLRPG